MLLQSLCGGLLCSSRRGHRGAHVIVRALSSVGVFAVSGLISFLYYQGLYTLWKRHLSSWYTGTAPLPFVALLFAIVWQCCVVLLTISYARVVGTDPGAVTQELSDEVRLSTHMGARFSSL